MHLRRATIADHDAVAEVTLAAYEPFLLQGADRYRGELADSARRDREAELWVACTDDTDTVVGTVTVCPPGSPWRELAGAGEGEFRMLAVAPTAQRTGVGQLLALLAMHRAATQGARAVVLSSLVEMTAAHALYRRLGFVRDPDRDWTTVTGKPLIAFRAALDGEPWTRR